MADLILLFTIFPAFNPKRRKSMINKKGFTLIELMIVIAIIGILAAIAIPNFIAYRDKAFCSYAEGDGQNVLAAISCYFAEPDNTTLSRASLLADTMCGYSITNEGRETIDELAGTSANDAIWQIRVYDNSGRCPRDETYFTFMGTSQKGYWDTP
jgi:prepilin-type N-terminal cleavage/methylation domain-containing protein